MNGQQAALYPANDNVVAYARTPAQVSRVLWP